MRKKVKIGIVFMITVAFNSICAYAQDLITTKDGDTIQAKILEVSKDEIKYKKYGYLDGPTFVVSQKDVVVVQYADGTVEAHDTRKKISSTVRKTEQEPFKIKYQWEVTAGFGYADGVSTKLYEDGSLTNKTKNNSCFIRPIILSTVHGVRISRYVFIGAGFDFQYAFSPHDDSYSKMEWDLFILPVFGNIKGFFPLGKKFGLYATISLGGNIVLGGNGVNDLSFSASSFGFGSSYDLQNVNVKGKIFEEYGLGFRYRKLNFSLGLSQQVFDLHPVVMYSTGGRYPVYKDSDAGDSAYIRVRINSFYFKVGVMF